jgi:diguanylate cyclase (GGDEF)-like protein/PAS domain S-box-containing protein
MLVHAKFASANTGTADSTEGASMDTEGFEHRSEAQLHQTLLEYQALLDNGLIGIAFTRNRILQHCNRRFGRMFGWPCDQLGGKSTSILYASEEGFQEIGRSAAQTIGNGQRLDSEVHAKRRDGTQFWCRVLGQPIDPHDPGKGTVFLVEDITERRNAQEALLQARDQLERRVVERTVELATANARLEAEIEERRLAEERIRHLAHHDVLTGLPNRRLLEDRLEQAMGMAKRNGTHVAIQFIDLDLFKAVNDRFGHRVGDLLLQAVARRLCSLLREADTVSRVGGDEFVVVLPDVDSPAAVAETAQRVLEALGRPYTIEGREFITTPSIGISLYPRQGDDVETLISRADAAMYHAKQMGRGIYKMFDMSSLPSG